MEVQEVQRRSLCAIEQREHIALLHVGVCVAHTLVHRPLTAESAQGIWEGAGRLVSCSNRCSKWYKNGKGARVLAVFVVILVAVLVAGMKE